MNNLGTKELDHNLLIIDDEIEVTKALTRQFRKKYNVFSTTDPEEAFGIMEKECIQVVLSDQRMPGMTGVDFFARIKDKYPDALKLILTGYTDIEAVIGAINNGQVFRYVTKPWNPVELDTIISEAFEKYELITQNRKLTQSLREANLFLEEKVEIRTRELEKLNSELIEINREKNKYITIVDAIFNSVQGLIYLCNADGQLVRWNKNFESITGYSPGELANKHLIDFFDTDTESQKAVSDTLQNTLLIGYGETEAVLTKKDGTQIHMNYTVSKLTIDGLVFFTGIGIDITERKRVEKEIVELNQKLEFKVLERTEKLQKSNRELESMSYSISHHLQTPLRAINGFSHIILEEYAASLDTKGMRLFQVIIDNTNKMGKLIEELLAFTVLRKVNLATSLIDMYALANEACNKYSGKSEKENPEIRLLIIPPVFGDQSLIREVWNCLIDNAIKFSAGERKCIIEIGSETANDSITYYVKDNGIGFNEAYAEKLFAVFQHLHTPNQFEGNGIGLAMVQRIIHSHKGRVWAEGKVNEGATFYFSLPLTNNL